jgi:histone deacetylase 6
VSTLLLLYRASRRDVHHGDGTQSIFEGEDSSGVLFISIHRHDNGAFYPRTGDAGSTGGRSGSCVNIPWPCGSMGDAEYAAAFELLVLPLIAEFEPELILVSAGTLVVYSLGQL